eukprot:scaffold165419_cov54-Attheya_sp.AAC.5
MRMPHMLALATLVGVNATVIDTRLSLSSMHNRLAVVRPFCVEDASSLVESFSVWDKFSPCQDPSGQVDLFLVFSQNIEKSPIANDAIGKVTQIFEQTHGWNSCFHSVTAIGVDIPAHLDIYEPAQQSTNPLWVNGPNSQFIKTLRHVQQEGSYETMFLMEGDTVPVKPYWMDKLLVDIEEQRPFAILGSKYKGDKWDGFLDQLPAPLINHINGNAIYNVSSPWMDSIASQLEKESTTDLNAVPYDYRISQIEEESNSWTNLGYWKMTPRDDIKETSVIANYASTTLLPSHVGDEVMTHGAEMYEAWDGSLGDVTLVVTDWHGFKSKKLLTRLDNIQAHPFSKVVIMLPVDMNITEFQWPKTSIQNRPGTPDYMDLCAAKVDTKWFMITNSLHQVHPYRQIMVNEENKIVVPFAPANDESCLSFPSCATSLKWAKEWDPLQNVVVRDFDMVFHTANRNAFCKSWEGRHGSKSKDPPTATAYVAYLESKAKARHDYEFLDRTIYGSRDHFVPLETTVLPKVRARNLALQSANSTGSNSTGCQLHVMEEECSNAANCEWNANGKNFSSCSVASPFNPNKSSGNGNIGSDSIMSDRGRVIASVLGSVGGAVIFGIIVAFVLRRSRDNDDEDDDHGTSPTEREDYLHGVQFDGQSMGTSTLYTDDEDELSRLGATGVSADISTNHSMLDTASHRLGDHGNIHSPYDEYDADIFPQVGALPDDQNNEGPLWSVLSFPSFD